MLEIANARATNVAYNVYEDNLRVMPETVTI